MQFDQPVVKSFDIIYQQIMKTFDCSYLSYALELNPLQRVHYFSNKDWESLFVTEKLIESCPLLEFAQKTNASVLEWNSLMGMMNKKQARVMQARASFNIGNGLALRQLFCGMSEIMTLASDKQNVHFSRHMLKNLTHLEHYILDIRLLGISNMITQGWIAQQEAQKIIDSINLKQCSSLQLH